MNNVLRDKLNQLPEDSGVYIMLGEEGNILYVGKAKVLRNRVKQYFASNLKAIKVEKLMERVVDFRYIITPSESDALSLENTLIKENNPPYNILLKDDKQFPFVRIDVKSTFPRVSVTRKIGKDNAKYFGPIMGSIKQFVTLVLDNFPLCSCGINLNKVAISHRPCLNFHLGRCLAPCLSTMDAQKYRQVVSECVDFLNGEHDVIRQRITTRMKEASMQLNFEQAQVCKEQLMQLDKLGQSRIVSLTQLVNYDIMTIVHNGECASVNVMLLRNGKIIFSDNHLVSDAGIDDRQTLSSFISMYYSTNSSTTSTLLVNALTEEELNPLSEFISSQLGRKVEVSLPQKGIKHKLIQMSLANASDFLDKNIEEVDKQYNRTFGALEQLKRDLNLSQLPKRIECYDISNISGVDKVASMVVTTNGKADNNSYRRFKIRTVEGANDFACMKEVLSRRFDRIKDNDSVFGLPPDLIVVDGGLGQLTYAVEALSESGLNIPIISLAKREELVYTTSREFPVRLPLNSYALKLLINIRDEAHRFAITYFRNLHNRNAFKSELNDIEGIGEKKQQGLIKYFKSIDAIKSANKEDLMQVQGINERLASNIINHFKLKY